MRKVSCWVLLSFIVCPVWADNCVLTTDMLSQGGGASYDDYLYADTSQRELRNEGKQGKAFLCGQIDGKTYCSVGTKKRMQYAAVGGENSVPDAVYECINTGSSDRTSFRWVAHDVQPNCTVKNKSEAKNVSGVDGGNGLFLVNGSYCKNIVENTTNVTIQEKQTNFWDTANTTLHTISNVTTSKINGGVQLVVSFSDNVTRRLNIMKDGVVEMWDGTGRTIASGVRSVVDGSVRAYNITADTYIKGLKITKDGVVELLGGAGSVIKTISDNTTKSYIATLGLFETVVSEVGKTARTAMTETGQTVRSWGNNVKDVTVSAIGGGVQLAVKFSDNAVQTFKIAGGTAVSILDNAGKNFNGALKIGADGAVRIYDSSMRTLLGGFKIATNGAVQIFDSSMSTIKTLSANTTDAYKATLKFFADNYNSFNGTVQTVIKETANSYNVTINALAGMANTVMTETGQTVRSWGNNVKDVTVSAIGGGVQLAVKFSDNAVQTFKIAGGTAVSILDNAGKNFNGALKIGADGAVRIYDSSMRTLLGGFKIATNGAVQIFDSSMSTIKTLSANTTDAYKATLKFFADNYNSFNGTVQTVIKETASSYNVTINALAGMVNTAMTETGQTVRAISSDATKVTVRAISGGVEIVDTIASNNTQRIKYMVNGTVSIVDAGGRTVVGVAQAAADGTVRIYEQTTNTMLGALRIGKDGVVQVMDVGGRVVETIAKSGTEAYKSTLQFFGNSLSAFNDTIQTVIKETANSYNITINALAGMANTAMTEGGKTARNLFDNAKETAISLFDHVFGTTVDEDDLNALKVQINNCTTAQQVEEIVNNKLQNAQLNENQLRQVREMLNKMAAETNQRFESIENWLNGLEQLAKDTAAKLENLGAQHRQLAALVRTKVNAKEVVDLIYTHTQKFTDGQEKQLYAILAEYTKQLSPGQYAQVQDMIKDYVDPKINALNSRVSLEAQQRVAADKVASAMSILNAFSSGADVSVWKNADGKFNGVRLASDATAGVVLGTAGGLISNSLIKKSQVEKGLEGVACTVGGQVVADYGDEFSVGMQ